MKKKPTKKPLNTVHGYGIVSNGKLIHLICPTRSEAKECLRYCDEEVKEHVVRVVLKAVER